MKFLINTAATVASCLAQEVGCVEEESGNEKGCTNNSALTKGVIVLVFALSGLLVTIACASFFFNDTDPCPWYGKKKDIETQESDTECDADDESGF